jgi:aminoglycoside/choline kinase family phosphotransferase
VALEWSPNGRKVSALGIAAAVHEARGLQAAARAWRTVSGAQDPPTSIEQVLSPKGRRPSKSSVFRLTWAGPQGASVIVKHSRRASMVVERFVYEQVLPLLPVDAPGLYGFLDDDDGYWLFLEEVVGEPFREGDPGDARLAAEWLAILHTGTTRMEHLANLQDRGPDHYLQELRSARNSLLARLSHPQTKSAELRPLVRHLDGLEAGWDQIQHACSAAPRSLVHGDFTSKNVLVQDEDGHAALVVMDWGSCGWGPPAPDLPVADIAHYRRAVRQTWPELDVPVLEEMAVIGSIFRTIAWVERTVTALDHRWHERAMRRMAHYTGELARLRSLMEQDRTR